MKIVSGALTVLLAGITLSPLAQAQGVPPGSYLQTCRDVGMRGGTLYAVCRTVDGRGRQTELRRVRRCVGDIGNNNGMLQCSYGDAQPYGQAPAPGYGAPPYGQGPPPGYGPPR
jgi:hypothetical protein